MRSTNALFMFASGSMMLLSGCGTVVPEIKEIYDQDVVIKYRDADNKEKEVRLTGATQIEYAITHKIFCDLQQAVKSAQQHLVTSRESATSVVKQSKLLPDDWIVQVALSLEVDETSSVSPGVTLNQVMPNAVSVFGPGTTGSVVTAQSFGLGIGASASATGTRIDKFNPIWSVRNVESRPVCGGDLFQDKHLATPSSSLLITSDLGIEDWLIGAMFVDMVIPSDHPKSASKGSSGGQQNGGSQKPESISTEIKFVIVTSGNVTPTWKLLRVSANTGNTPLLNAGRTRTHDLIITIGPDSTQTNNSHLAAQIGNAVRSGSAPQ